MMLRLFLLFFALFGFAQSASAFVANPEYSGILGDNFYIECDRGGTNNIIYDTDTELVFDYSNCPYLSGGYFSAGNVGNFVAIEYDYSDGDCVSVLSYNDCNAIALSKVYFSVPVYNEYFTNIVFFPTPFPSFQIMTPLDASQMIANVSSGVQETGMNFWAIVALIIGVLITWEIMHRIIEIMPNDENTK